ncbi:MAG: hypothetical protein JW881_05200 [Spirochaetales bacterium]|nr:hypothetical protein [Spirochaetales bacterium]
MRHNIRNAFINEEFSVNRLNYENNIYQVRKEDILITIRQDASSILLSTSPANEQLVRLIIVEVIVELKDFFTGIEKMKNLDEIGSRIIKKTI